MTLSGVVLVTGTGTGVGKTVATAALAGQALNAGLRVAVVKPVQTGVAPGEPGDVEEVRRMLQAHPGRDRLRIHEFFRLPDPLAPQAAAKHAGAVLPALQEHARRIRELAAGADLVLVEGAGGVLVRLDDGDGTIADLAALLAGDDGVAAGMVVVTGAELGTLNLTELTVEALRRRGVPVEGLVIGLWPDRPGTAEQGNLADLPRLNSARLLGVIAQAPPLPPVLLDPSFLPGPEEG